MLLDDFASLAIAQDEQAWADELFLLAKKLGFEQTLFALIKSKNEPYDKAFIKSNYDPSWRAAYDRHKFNDIDPTVIHSLKSVTPLVWGPEIFTDPHQQEMLEEAAKYGLTNGIVYPIHGPNGEFGLITFVAESLKNKADQKKLLETMPTLAIIRDYAFETSIKFLAADNAHLPVVLTPREKEILKWTMEGKSMWEISKILNCSESNINFHITNIRHKFGVNNKYHAIIKAIHMGLIDE